MTRILNYADYTTVIIEISAENVIFKDMQLSHSSKTGERAPKCFLPCIARNF